MGSTPTLTLVTYMAAGLRESKSSHDGNYMIIWIQNDCKLYESIHLDFGPACILVWSIY